MKEEKNKTRSVAVRVYDAFLALGLFGVAFLVGIILLVSVVFFYDYLDKIHEKKFRSCGAAEYIARAIETSIAGYYADPANQDLPKLEILLKDNNISLEYGKFKHSAAIEEIPTASSIYPAIKITVFLDEDCDYPRGNKFVKYMPSSDEAGVSRDDPEGWNY